MAHENNVSCAGTELAKGLGLIQRLKQQQKTWNILSS